MPRPSLPGFFGALSAQENRTMYVKLVCSKCGDSSLVSFALLYDVWKEGYAKMCPDHQKKAKATADIKCHCGHKERYNGPMFQYVFQLIFDEFIKKVEV
jgi:hypothetical protein